MKGESLYVSYIHKRFVSSTAGTFIPHFILSGTVSKAHVYQEQKKWGIYIEVSCSAIERSDYLLKNLRETFDSVRLKWYLLNHKYSLVALTLNTKR